MPPYELSYGHLPTANDLVNRYVGKHGSSGPVDVSKLPPLPETDYDPMQLAHLSQRERLGELETLVMQQQEEIRRLKSDKSTLEAELQTATLFG